MLTAKIEALCSRIGLAVPQQNAEGAFELHFAGKLSVDIRRLGAELALRGVVGALPEEEEEREKLCRRLLSLASGRMQKECERFFPVLSLRDKVLELSLTLAMDLSLDDLEAALELLLNLLETWQQLTENSARSTRVFSSASPMIMGIRP
jgi:Tir chaperone protein (CesT).